MSTPGLDSPRPAPPELVVVDRVGSAPSRGDEEFALRIRPRLVLRLLLGSTAALVAIHVGYLVLRYGFGHDWVWGSARFFDLWSENTVPAWFASATLLACSVLLAVTAAATRRARQPGFAHWIGLALLFAFVSVDESLALHERLMAPVREAFGLGGPLLFAWVVPYGMAMLLLALVYFRFLMRLPRRIRSLFLLAAALFLGGSLGVEMIGGVVYEAGGFRRAVPIEICNAVEEAMEMGGVAIFLYALTLHLESSHRGLRIVFGDQRGTR